MPPKVPTHVDLMWPTIKALKAMDGSGSNDELLVKVTELEGIPEEVSSITHKDGRQSKLSYRLAWARTYLRMVGALENSARGVWALTDAGRRLTVEDMKMIPAQIKALLQGEYKADAKDTVRKGEEERDVVDTDNWKSILLDKLKLLCPGDFERLAQRLLREAGFIKVEVTGKSGDGGIDGIGVLRINLLSFKVFFQCKRYQGSVGPGVIRDFRGALSGRGDKGLVITTGTFSAGAKQEATRDGAHPIDLIDGDQLCDLLKDLKLGVGIETIEKPIVDEEWFKKFAS